MQTRNNTRRILHACTCASGGARHKGPSQRAAAAVLHKIAERTTAGDDRGRTACGAPWRRAIRGSYTTLPVEALVPAPAPAPALTLTPSSSYMLRRRGKRRLQSGCEMRPFVRALLNTSLLLVDIGFCAIRSRAELALRLGCGYRCCCPPAAVSVQPESCERGGVFVA